jgi:hypothetical protein
MGARTGGRRIGQLSSQAQPDKTAAFRRWRRAIERHLTQKGSVRKRATSPGGLAGRRRKPPRRAAKNWRLRRAGSPTNPGGRPLRPAHRSIPSTRSIGVVGHLTVLPRPAARRPCSRCCGRKLSPLALHGPAFAHGPSLCGIATCGASAHPLRTGLHRIGDCPDFPRRCFGVLYAPS